MLDDDNLRQRALTGTGALLASVLRGRIALDPGDSSIEWDGQLRRHVFHQDVVAWHEFAQVRIGVSVAGQVLHFRDESRFEDAVYRRLSEDEVLEICRTTGLVGKRVERVEIDAADEMLAATVVQKHHRLPGRIEFIIHCTLRQVAALQVVPAA
jgi:hypothetical protein